LGKKVCSHQDRHYSHILTANSTPLSKFRPSLSVLTYIINGLKSNNISTTRTHYIPFVIIDRPVVRFSSFIFCPGQLLLQNFSAEQMIRFDVGEEFSAGSFTGGNGVEELWKKNYSHLNKLKCNILFITQHPLLSSNLYTTCLSIN